VLTSHALYALPEWNSSQAASFVDRQIDLLSNNDPKAMEPWRLRKVLKDINRSCNEVRKAVRTTHAFEGLEITNPSALFFSQSIVPVYFPNSTYALIWAPWSVETTVKRKIHCTEVATLCRKMCLGNRPTRHGTIKRPVVFVWLRWTLLRFSRALTTSKWTATPASMDCTCTKMENF
jgi:hypothetical protein